MEMRPGVESEQDSCQNQSGMDVPFHSLLESFLSMQLPIGPIPGLPILIKAS